MLVIPHLAPHRKHEEPRSIIGLKGPERCSLLHTLTWNQRGDRGLPSLRYARPYALCEALLYMEPKIRPQQRTFVREILLQRSDGHPSPRSRAGCRQLLHTDPEQNLNSRLEDRVYTRGGTRVDRRLSWLRTACCLLRQMRTPNLRLSSSNSCKHRCRHNH